MKALIAAALFATAAAPAIAQTAPAPGFRPEPSPAPRIPTSAPAPGATSTAPKTPPKLIVAISVDQFSADLFQQYRNHFTEGFARLLTGVVFPSGYQSHAATETCPGHSTILTGMRPAHTGIVANNWVEQGIARADKIVYCTEDETVPGTDHEHYVVSDKHLKVPTLGEMMKAADPRTRVVSVAGKDRAAVMMGGHKVDELWWWDGKTYSTYAGRPVPRAVQRGRDAVAALVAKPQEPLPLPSYCQALDRPITVAGKVYGQGRFARAAGDLKGFRVSPASDAAVFAIAAGLIQDMGLGKGPQTDIIDIGASATDYIGHALGTQGTEMCIQMDQLDHTLGSFLNTLDSWGIDYEVVLTADHGAHDMTERQQQHAMPMEEHVSGDASIKVVNAALMRDFGLTVPALVGAEGDVYLGKDLPAALRPRVLAEAQKRFAAMPQVAGAFTRAQIAATPFATTPPENWTLIERARASFNPDVSGDLLVLLKPRVTTIEEPKEGYIETHGSPWDYDRRVPILFWRKGIAGFEQPLSVETVDIAPTLAATIHLPVKGLDGRCLDLDPGTGDTCAR
ncbi:alkaline phosphatase [Arthrobacter sp. TPD3018]|uniref:alkaline phosphatase family protein n=1 Tax=Bacteria TaxID=2 RepID=UPI000D524824|nr:MULTISPECIES: alkaline phosphatase family protein [Bacteria]PVE55958.1 alkaline phosphatase [Sphingomonas sp. TPD3009]PVE57703.1 alkaline phosphatase [Arthrobacter sp. TPD3018]PVE83324.1 alkaline phosphatase [Sphingomonas melonis]